MSRPGPPERWLVVLALVGSAALVAWPLVQLWSDVGSICSTGSRSIDGLWTAAVGCTALVTGVASFVPVLWERWSHRLASCMLITGLSVALTLPAVELMAGSPSLNRLPAALLLGAILGLMLVPVALLPFGVLELGLALRRSLGPRPG